MHVGLEKDGEVLSANRVIWDDSRFGLMHFILLHRRNCSFQSVSLFTPRSSSSKPIKIKKCKSVGTKMNPGSMDQSNSL